jgi:hypothetical protein
MANSCTICIGGYTVLSSFHVCNGVRQVGDLSPLLFSIYSYDLYYKLGQCHAGIQLTPNALLLNTFSFASDVVSASVAGLRNLLPIN